jgi:hypothetical protein
MLISELMREGRQLYAQCDRCHRRVPLDLSQFPPDIDYVDLGNRLKCSQLSDINTCETKLAS